MHVLPTTAHHALGCNRTRTEQNAYELYVHMNPAEENGILELQLQCS